MWTGKWAGLAILVAGCATWCGTEDASKKSRSSVVDFASGMTLDKVALQSDLQRMTSAPHPFGSTAQASLALFIEEAVRQAGLEPVVQSFSAATPNPILLNEPNSTAELTLTLSGQNIFARLNLVAAPECVILIGSHYDTKIVDGLDYVGANDSASSSAMLLELARFLRGKSLPEALRCDIAFVWFDGEEAMLPEWRDGELRHPAKLKDNTYGSRHFASQLASCAASSTGYCLPASMGSSPLAAVIIVDMIGSPQLRYTPDTYSNTTLKRAFAQSLQDLGFSSRLSSQSLPVEDDHIPFVQLGVPAMDVIDFHNLDHWHKDGDTLASISLQSIEDTAKSVVLLFLRLAANPQVFQ